MLMLVVGEWVRVVGGGGIGVLGAAMVVLLALLLAVEIV